MDQSKTGKFIAEERKRKNYTQRQLAEILGISDKTISKWECGNGFPEVSLLLPLCEELEITVNELLTGERLQQGDYIKKAEENMVNFVREKEENKIKMRLSMLLGIVSLVAFITLLLVVCIYTNEIDLVAKIVLSIIAGTIFIIGFVVVMQGGRTIGYYKCSHCRDTFVPGFMEYTMGMNLVSRRRLKCPHCGKSSWCKKVLTKEETKL